VCTSVQNEWTKFVFHVKAKAEKKQKTRTQIEQPQTAPAFPLMANDALKAVTYINEQAEGLPKILVAEDLEFNRMAIEHVFIKELGLKKSDFILVNNGKKAIDALVEQIKEQNHLKLVLLDYNMPLYNGV
jgi:PleD family two-component response regulator